MDHSCDGGRCWQISPGLAFRKTCNVTCSNVSQKFETALFCKLTFLAMKSSYKWLSPNFHGTRNGGGNSSCLCCYKILLFLGTGFKMALDEFW